MAGGEECVFSGVTFWSRVKGIYTNIAERGILSGLVAIPSQEATVHSHFYKRGCGMVHLQEIFFFCLFGCFFFFSLYLVLSCQGCTHYLFTKMKRSNINENNTKENEI
jgi:hypothetical protein